MFSILNDAQIFVSTFKNYSPIASHTQFCNDAKQYKNKEARTKTKTLFCFSVRSMFLTIHQAVI